MTIERIENPMFRITWECLDFKMFIEDLETILAHSPSIETNASRRILNFLHEANKRYDDKNS